MKTWKIVVSAIVLFAVSSIVVRKVFFNEFGSQTVIEAIITAGIVSAIFFTLGLKLLKRSSKKLLESIPDVELSNDEKLLLEAGASHYRGIEAVGGKLILTDKRLIFKSHNLNLQNHQQEFPITKIKAVAHYESKASNKIFKLELTNNEIHKFLVDSPSDWIKAIPH